MTNSPFALRSRHACFGLFVLLSAMLSHDGHAVSVEYLTLSEVVKNADVVSRIRIVGREPVWFGFGANQEICGYRYRANVVLGFRGQIDSFEFFAGNPNDFEGFDTDYLLIASRVPIEQRRSTADSTLKNLKGISRERLECELSASEIFVRPGRQKLIPFYKKTSELIKEGEWLHPSRLSPISNVEFEIQEVDGERSIGGHVVKWSDIKNVIKEALGQEALDCTLPGRS